MPCQNGCDVVGVEAPLGGVAQVIFHGVQVVEVGVQVRVHQDRGEEEDGEGQVEVEREVGEDQGETHMCDMQMTRDERLNELEPRGSWLNIKTRKTTDGALLCSLVQIVRVVILRVILVGVLGVMIVVLIGHDEVLVFTQPSL